MPELNMLKYKVSLDNNNIYIKLTDTNLNKYWGKISNYDINYKYNLPIEFLYHYIKDFNNCSKYTHDNLVFTIVSNTISTKHVNILLNTTHSADLVI